MALVVVCQARAKLVSRNLFPAEDYDTCPYKSMAEYIEVFHIHSHSRGWHACMACIIGFFLMDA